MTLLKLAYSHILPLITHASLNCDNDDQEQVMNCDWSASNKCNALIGGSPSDIRDIDCWVIIVEVKSTKNKKQKA